MDEACPEMNADRWQQIKWALEELFAAPATRHEEILQRHCGTDDELRQEVRELWLADAQGGKTAAHIAGVAWEAANDGALEPGERLGPFGVVREIGRGGMGIVYLAERREPFRQLAAIKVIARRRGPEFMAAFVRERQILASLEHPAIARVLDGGETSRGTPYLVMEYVEGRPLHGEGGNRRLVDQLIEVCEAVTFAHDRLVVHGDLKPENILVTPEGRVKLLDFGVAALGAGGVYSAGFASPEQERGDRLTPASDVFSLGRILAGLAAAPDAELAAILRRACATNMADRYPSARELGADLRRWREGRAVHAYSTSGAYRAWAWVRRNPWVAVASATAVLFLVGGLLVSLRQTKLALAASATAEREARSALAARRMAEQQRGEAEAARQRAEASDAASRRRYAEMFQLSMAVLADFYEPARAPDFPTAARKWMVEKAQARLAALSRENPRDEHVREALADAYVKVGDLLGNPSHANLGNVPAAAAAYRKADAILASLHSSEAVLRKIQLAMRRADLLTLTGQAGEASRLYGAAAAAWRRLPASGDPETGRGLSVALMKSAQGLILESKFTAARPQLDESLAIVRPLALAEPGNSRMQRTLISVLSRLAYLARQMDHQPEARQWLAEAAAVGERAMARLPDDSDLRQNTAFVYSQLGLVEGDLSLPEAGKAYARGLELGDAELKRDARNDQGRNTWATVAVNLSQWQWNRGDRTSALALLRRVVELRQAWAGETGAPQLRKLEAARARASLALRLQAMGEVDEAVRQGAQAMEEFDRFGERSDFRVNREHALALYDFGVVLKAAGQSAGSRAAWLRARDMLAPLTATQPRLREVYEDLGQRLAAQP